MSAEDAVVPIFLFQYIIIGQHFFLFIFIIIIIIMSIPCRLRQDARPGLQSLGAGYNKSPRVRSLSFPSSYRNSTFLSIFAVPNYAVIWINSNLTITPIRFMYSLKLTDTALRNPNNNRHYNDFSHAPDVQFHLSKGGISLTSQVPYL